jgi:hypothetical protein
MNAKVTWVEVNKNWRGKVLFVLKENDVRIFELTPLNIK